MNLPQKPQTISPKPSRNPPETNARRYALFEELQAREPDRAREVYRAALKLVPHAAFTFSKLWVLAAKLELRQGRLDAARRILGTALGMAPKDKTFRARALGRAGGSGRFSRGSRDC